MEEKRESKETSVLFLLKDFLVHVRYLCGHCGCCEKEKLEDEIGDVMLLLQVEAVGNAHQSHSFVRGDRLRSDETTPMIVIKFCHDLDMIQWFVGKRQFVRSINGKFTK